MYNKSQLSKDERLAKEPKKLAKPKDVDYVSKMGYRDDSPFNTRPYIDINTPNGLIDMSNTGIPLLANGQYLPPYSGMHQFDTDVVREIPLAEEGGTIMELTDDEIKMYRDAGYVVDLTPYPSRHNPANAFPVTDPRSMQDGGTPVVTPPSAAPVEDEIKPVYTNPVYGDVIKWLDEHPMYIDDKGTQLNISKYEQIDTQNMYPKISGKLLYIPRAGYFNEDQYKLVQEFPVEGQDPIRIYEVLGSAGNKKYIVDNKDFNKEFFSIYQPSQGRTREIFPVYNRRFYSGTGYQSGGNIQFQDGGQLYQLSGSPAIYRKVGNKWEVDWNKSGNFQPISKGDVKKREANLNKNAKPIYGTENPFTNNWVNNFTTTDAALTRASNAAPTVENAKKLNRLINQRAIQDAKAEAESQALQQKQITDVPLAQVSDNTQTYSDDVERAAIASKPLVDAAKKRQAEFQKKLWEQYNKMSASERAIDRVKGFMSDPFGMTSRAVMGEQGYLPGMGEGLLPNNPYYKDYISALGYTPGEMDMFNIQSMINPMYWGASIGNNMRQGNYLDAGIEAALTFAPMAPKGTGSNIVRGAQMIQDDVARGANYLTTKTPLKNTYKINPWAVKENPEMFLYRAEPKNFNTQSTVDFMKQEIAAGREKPWYKGVIKSYEEGHPKLVAQNDFHGQWFEKDPSRLDFYLNSGDKYDADTQMNIFRKKIPTSQAKEFSVLNNEKANVISASPNTEFVLPRNMVESAEIFPQSSWQDLIQQDKTFNTPHWLKGYKPVEVPGQLPGSPNALNRNKLFPDDVVYSKEGANYTVEDVLRHEPTLIDIRAERLAALQTPEGRARMDQYLRDNPYIQGKSDGSIEIDPFIPSYEDVLSGIANMKHASTEYIELRKILDEGAEAYRRGEISQEQLEKGIEQIKEYMDVLQYDPMNAYMVPNLKTQGEESMIMLGAGLSPLDARVAARHEFGHFFGVGKKSHLDTELEQITLNDKTVPEINVSSKESALTKKWRANPEYMKKSKDYWVTGSDGSEKVSFLEEVRAMMLEDGTIQNIYDPITPEMLQAHYKKYKQGQIPYSLRIYDIMENTSKNFNIMSSVLNKMPAAVPVTIGVGAAASLPEQRKGGYVDDQITHFQDGGNTDPGNNALELHMFYDKHNVKQMGGSVMYMSDDEIKRYRDAGYVIVED